MRARDDDGRARRLVARLALAVGGLAGRRRVAHVDDDGFDALVVLVVLAGRLLVGRAVRVGEAARAVMRQLCFHAVADLHDGEVLGGLQDRAGDQLAFATRELLVDVHAGGVAHNLVDHALGRLRGDAARVIGGDVLHLVIGVVARLGVLVADAHHLVDVDAARVAVDGRARVPVEFEGAGIGLRQRLFEAVQNDELVDAVHLRQLLQSQDQLGRCARFFLCHDA